MSIETQERQRLDQWLWYARFFKTRSLASKVCRARKIRIDGTPQSKASALVSPGQVLTFPQAKRIRVVRILKLGERRGPAAEAQALYEDLSPALPGRETKASPLSRQPAAAREPGTGRPTKRDRRAIDRLRAE